MVALTKISEESAISSDSTLHHIEYFTSEDLECLK